MRRQVKFECTDEFYARLQDQKLRRALTVQQLITRSLNLYFAVPESLHRAGEEKAKRSKNAAELEHSEHRGAIEQYLAQMPVEKVRLVREALALDLRYYRRSRFRPPAK